MSTDDELVALASQRVSEYVGELAYDRRMVAHTHSIAFADGPPQIMVTYATVADYEDVMAQSRTRMGEFVHELQEMVGHAECADPVVDVEARTVTCGCGREIVRYP